MGPELEVSPGFLLESPELIGTDCELFIPLLLRTTPFPESLLGFPVNVCWIFWVSPVVRFLRHPAAFLVGSAHVKTHTGLEAVGSLFPPACIWGFIGKHCYLVVL